MKHIFIFLFVFAISISTVQAQCEIEAKVTPLKICYGDSVKLKSFGGCNFLMNNDFNNQTLGVGWSSMLANPVFNNPCGPGPDAAYAWVGTTNSNQRTLTTQSYNIAIGGCTIDFWMRYGREQNMGTCEDPDAADEGVHLQYSANGGPWVDLPGPHLDPQGNNSTTPPFTTYQDGKGGYWPAVSGVSSQNASSLYFWNHYSCDVPNAASTPNTRFRWAQLATSNSGFDAWGIDVVEIVCPDTSTVYVEWLDETGNTVGTGYVGGYVHPTHSQWYYVVVTDSASGFTAIDSSYVEVDTLLKPFLPRPNILISDQMPCQGDSIDIAIDGVIDTNLTYVWSIEGVDYSLPGPYTYTCANADSFEVSLELETPFGCVTDDTIKIVDVQQRPLLSFVPDVFSGCSPLDVTFTNSTQPAGTSVVWDFGDGNTSTDYSPTHTYVSSGKFDISIVGTTPANCVDSVRLADLIDIKVSPIADFAPDNFTVSFKNPVITFTNNSVDLATCEWDFGDGRTSTLENPGSVTFPGPGDYTVCLDVYSADGCYSMICKDVRVVVDEIEVPNIITPNGDGKNDKLQIDNISDLESATIVIYNRWGKKVFETDNYQNDWDAEGLSDGVYFWTIKYTTFLHDEVSINGSVTVMRE